MRLGALLLVVGCATAPGQPSSQAAALAEPGPADVAALRADLAELLYRHGHGDDALALAQQALAQAPSSARLHTLSGVLLARKGLYGQAEQELVRALACDHGFAAAHDALGVLYDRTHRSAQALGEHEAAVQAAPGCARCWNNLGFSLYLAHRDHEAVTALETAVRLDPHSRAASNNLGFAYLRAGDPAAAARAFRQAAGETGAQKNLALGRALPARKGAP